MTTHFEGPILGSHRSIRGAGQNAPIDLVSHAQQFGYFNDFVSIEDYDATNEFTLTQVAAAGTAALFSMPEGGLLLTPGANAGPIVQLDGSGTARWFHDVSFVANATDVDKESVFGARFSLVDADETDYFIGLAELHATSAVLTAAGALTSDNHAGFHILDADDGTVRFSAAGTADTSAQTVESLFTLTDLEWVDVAVRVRGNRYATGYFRTGGHRSGVWKSTPTIDLGTGNPFDGDMFPTVGIIGVGAGDTSVVDHIWFHTDRDTRR